MKSIIAITILFTVITVQADPYKSNQQGFKPNAYGLGVGSTIGGKAVSHPPLQKLKKDAYGMGGSSDQYGRPVKTDLWGAPVK